MLDGRLDLLLDWIGFPNWAIHETSTVHYKNGSLGSKLVAFHSTMGAKSTSFYIVSRTLSIACALKRQFELHAITDRERRRWLYSHSLCVRAHRSINLVLVAFCMTPYDSSSQPAGILWSSTSILTYRHCIWKDFYPQSGQAVWVVAT